MSAIPELNAVQIAGRLARPPKSKLSRRGVTVAELSVELKKTKILPDDTESVRLTYVIVEFWDRPAARLLKLDLKTGTGIMIEGLLWLQVFKACGTCKRGPRLIVMGNKFKVLEVPDEVYAPEEGQ